MYIYNSPQCAETANIDEIALENWVLYLSVNFKIRTHTQRSRVTAIGRTTLNTVPIFFCVKAYSKIVILECL